MKAIVMRETGGPEVLKLEDVPKPQPTENQVRVRVKAAGINHVDLWLRRGSPAYPFRPPHIPGADGAGVVEAVGPEAEGLTPGERVLIVPGLACGRCAYCRSGRDNQCDTFEIFGTKRNGTYAEYALVPDTNLVPIPPEMSFEDAAAFPLAYLTAWHMLLGRAKLQKGETVLVVGASAGVGIAAIQIAKAHGARVLAVSSSEEKLARLKAAGADDAGVAGNAAAIAGWVNEKTGGAGVEIAFEHPGPATFDGSLKSLARYGRLVTCGATSGPEVTVDLRRLFSRDISILGAKMGTQREFRDLALAVFSGKIKPQISDVLPLEKAAEAHARLESRAQIGKIVLAI